MLHVFTSALHKQWVTEMWTSCSRITNRNIISKFRFYYECLMYYSIIYVEVENKKYGKYYIPLQLYAINLQGILNKCKRSWNYSKPCVDKCVSVIRLAERITYELRTHHIEKRACTSRRERKVPDEWNNKQVINALRLPAARDGGNVNREPPSPLGRTLSTSH